MRSGSGLVLSADPIAEQMDLERRLPIYGPSNNAEMDRMEFYHESIMGAEIVEWIAPAPGKQILDATLGGGGHSAMLLEGGAHVIGLDQDREAIEHATARLEGHGDRFLPLQGNFSRMDELLASVGVDQVDGILLDLGVSSRQLDDAERGFSFRADAPLDMRMDRESSLTAREVVNEWPLEEITRILRSFGEENKAARIARRIGEERSAEPIETTGRLARIIESVVPKTGRKHPATKSFQAIRIAVNRELDVLVEGLEKALSLLAPGGVLAVISFHSLEDRIVKQFLRERSLRELDRPEWPEPRPNPDWSLDLPVRRSITPSESEIERNPRARSARLRIAVRR